MSPRQRGRRNNPKLMPNLPAIRKAVGALSEFYANSIANELSPSDKYKWQDDTGVVRLLIDQEPAIGLLASQLGIDSASSISVIRNIKGRFIEIGTAPPSEAKILARAVVLAVEATGTIVNPSVLKDFGEANVRSCVEKLGKDQSPAAAILQLTIEQQYGK